jgi:hypothetical protein
LKSEKERNDDRKNFTPKRVQPETLRRVSSPDFLTDDTKTWMGCKLRLPHR